MTRNPGPISRLSGNFPGPGNPLRNPNRSPLVLSETAFHPRRGKSSLNFFQPHCTVTELASAPPPLPLYKSIYICFYILDYFDYKQIAYKMLRFVKILFSLKTTGIIMYIYLKFILQRVGYLYWNVKSFCTE